VNSNKKLVFLNDKVMKKVVIIGGGFAGINLAGGLAGKKDFHVTIVDRNNYNFFSPLIYQIATGYLEPSNISYPFRRLWRKKENIRFHMAEFQKVIPGERKVILSTGEMSYDYLVFATGTRTNYFGLDNVQKNALPMKTLSDALALRNYLLQVMEYAARTSDEGERRKHLTIVVAGAGPTGVELSGMLAEMKRNVVPKDYPELVGNAYESHIYLVEAASKVLPPMSEKSQVDTFDALTKLGVKIKLGLQVKDYVDETVIFTNGETIQTKTLIWAAGVTGSVFEGIPLSCYGRGKRLIVDEYNEIQGLPNVFAIGDICLQTSDSKFPNGHPQLAQPAIQQGSQLAKNLIAIESGKARNPFSYFDKGTMAIIGRNKAVVDIPKPRVHFKGFIAWVMWIFVHLLFLVNYRNRIRTLYNWTTAYFSKDQTFRMIVRAESEQNRAA
jgi:NADH:ubiquinone reductase (H+-translocating)